MVFVTSASSRPIPIDEAVRRADEPVHFEALPIAEAKSRDLLPFGVADATKLCPRARDLQSPAVTRASWDKGVAREGKNPEGADESAREAAEANYQLYAAGTQRRTGKGAVHTSETPVIGTVSADQMISNPAFRLHVRSTILAAVADAQGRIGERPVDKEHSRNFFHGDIDFGGIAPGVLGDGVAELMRDLSKAWLGIAASERVPTVEEALGCLAQAAAAGMEVDQRQGAGVPAPPAFDAAHRALAEALAALAGPGYALTMPQAYLKSVRACVVLGVCVCFAYLRVCVCARKEVVDERMNTHLALAFRVQTKPNFVRQHTENGAASSINLKLLRSDTSACPPPRAPLRST